MVFYIFFSLCSEYKYEGESKVLQYFGNMRHISAVLDAFAEVVKLTNHTGL